MKRRTTTHAVNNTKQKSALIHILLGSATIIFLWIFLFSSPEPKKVVLKSKHLLKTFTSEYQKAATDRNLVSHSLRLQPNTDINRVTAASSSPKVEENEPTQLTKNRVDTASKDSISNNEVPIMDVIKNLYNIGSKDPDQLILLLHEDPLHVKVSTTNEFLCPTSPELRLTLPDKIDHSVPDKFRNGDEGTWVLFQHLRKAGGTAFCDLSTKNLGKKAVPPYFCMPDNRGSLAIPPWNDGNFIYGTPR